MTNKILCLTTKFCNISLHSTDIPTEGVLTATDTVQHQPHNTFISDWSFRRNGKPFVQVAISSPISLSKSQPHFMFKDMLTIEWTEQKGSTHTIITKTGFNILNAQLNVIESINYTDLLLQFAEVTQTSSSQKKEKQIIPYRVKAFIWALENTSFYFYGYSLKKLGEKLCVHPSTISNWLRRKTVPRVNLVNEIIDECTKCYNDVSEMLLNEFTQEIKQFQMKNSVNSSIKTQGKKTSCCGSCNTQKPATNNQWQDVYAGKVDFLKSKIDTLKTKLDEIPTPQIKKSDMKAACQEYLATLQKVLIEISEKYAVDADGLSLEAISQAFNQFEE